MTSQPCNETFIHKNSDPQFNMLTFQKNDNSNFDSIKQRDSDNNIEKMILIAIALNKSMM